MPVTVTPPDIPDSALIFDAEETRTILCFFWPGEAGAIRDISVSNDVRRFAQTILIAAIDASYAMGFVDALVDSVRSPSGGLKKLGKKLARNFGKQWFKHATQDDLEDVKVYYTVRNVIAIRYRTALLEVMQRMARRLQLHPLQLSGNLGSGRYLG